MQDEILETYTTMTPEELIHQAVEDAVRLDNQSNPRKKLLTTSERNIAFHIGAALQHIIRDKDEFMGYQVDVEYHRQGAENDPKKFDGKMSFLIFSFTKGASPMKRTKRQIIYIWKLRS